MPSEASLDVQHLPVAEALGRLRGRTVVPIPFSDKLLTEDLTVPGRAGGVPVRVYRKDERPRGVIANFHGGGWVLGSIAQDEFLCHSLAAATGCAVVSAEYRLAPETPYPGPLDDCEAVAAWSAELARSLTGRSDRLILCGSSAGANLATAVALRARDAGSFPIAAQLLLYPVCDARMTTASYAQFATGYHLTRAAMAWFWDLYVPAGIDRAPAEISPMNAASLAGMPRTLVVTAEYDPLRDEGAAYARKLAADGVPMRYVMMEGLVHGFFRMVPAASWVERVIALMVQTVDEALEPVS